MPSFHCLGRERRWLSASLTNYLGPNSRRKELATKNNPPEALPCATAKATTTHNPLLPSQEEILLLASAIASVLDQLKGSVVEKRGFSDETSISISTHFAHLQGATQALSNLLKCDLSDRVQIPETPEWNDTTLLGSSSHEKETVEDPRGLLLPMSDASNSLFDLPGISCGRYNDQSTPKKQYTPIMASNTVRQSSTPFLLSSPHVPPLKLPKQRPSPLSSTDMHDQPAPVSPQPDETHSFQSRPNTPPNTLPLCLNRRHTTSPSHETQRPRQTSEPRSAAAELSPCAHRRRTLRMLNGGDGSPVEGLGHRRRQFSTEDKTRRLRSLRTTTAPPLPRCTPGEGGGGRDVGDGAEEEPLRMEELMEFLRAGNSMREL